MTKNSLELKTLLDNLEEKRKARKQIQEKKAYASTFEEYEETSSRLWKVGVAAVFLAALTVLFFGNPAFSFAATAKPITLPFSYDFHINGSLDEANNASLSSSAYWWVASGARLNLSNGVGSTFAGNVPSASAWYKEYALSNPTATDNGAHPQNVFQMFLRSPQLNPSVQFYVKRDKDNLSNPANQNAWLGESLLFRYVDSNNFYYAGIRADGGAVIKKKTNGVYQTLAYKKVLSGTYNAQTSSDLIPQNQWIGLKATVANDASGNPKISFYTDQGKTGVWTLALEVVDAPAVYGAPINSSGLVGIQSDFADAQIDNFLLDNAVAVGTPVSLPVPQPTPTPIPTPTPTPAPSTSALFSDSFASYPDGLITNEFAYWSPTDPTAKQSVNWEMTSGSLFAQGGMGWSGVPNDGAPNALSTTGNNSSVFRLTTKRADFGDVAVTFDLLNQGLNSSSFTPAVDWDGVHVFLRYQSEYNLYYASINRRDNAVVIKKKVPGGPSNNGTYYDMSTYNTHAVPYGTWQNVKATSKNNPDGSVTLQLFANGVLVATATDNGTIGGAPIRSPGKVGIRGDNANIKFKNFVVSPL